MGLSVTLILLTINERIEKKVELAQPYVKDSLLDWPEPNSEPETDSTIPDS